jgi:aspartyl-tRNA(Asn)/glutamyl-tRNA(Gln) amidotransferase subunit B
MYSADENEYGVCRIINLSVITLGHPGTLPKVNCTAVEFAMKMGLATNCNHPARQPAQQNHFYP